MMRSSFVERMRRAATVFAASSGHNCRFSPRFLRAGGWGERREKGPGPAENRRSGPHAVATEASGERLLRPREEAHPHPLCRRRRSGRQQLPSLSYSQHREEFRGIASHAGTAPQVRRVSRVPHSPHAVFRRALRVAPHAAVIDEMCGVH